MNKIRERISGLEGELKAELRNSDLINAALTRGNLQGIQFAQEDILKIIDDIEKKHHGSWILNELKKQIK